MPARRHYSLSVGPAVMVTQMRVPLR
jgi:hypothetical protein